jgi:hypothetical protein
MSLFPRPLSVPYEGILILAPIATAALRHEEVVFSIATSYQRIYMRIRYGSDRIIASPVLPDSESPSYYNEGIKMNAVMHPP